MAAIYFVGLFMLLPAAENHDRSISKSLVKIRGELFSKVQKLPVKYHDNHTHGDIMSRYTNDLRCSCEML
jgi:ATP-binding cassette subfamily B protein